MVLGLLVFAAGLSACDDLREVIVLKGGTVLRLLNDGGLQRQPTKDLDASLLGEPSEFSERIETEVVDRCSEIMRAHFGDPMQFAARAIEQG